MTIYNALEVKLHRNGNLSSQTNPKLCFIIYGVWGLVAHVAIILLVP